MSKLSIGITMAMIKIVFNLIIIFSSAPKIVAGACRQPTLFTVNAHILLHSG